MTSHYMICKQVEFYYNITGAHTIHAQEKIKTIISQKPKPQKNIFITKIAKQRDLVPCATVD